MTVTVLMPTSEKKQNYYCFEFNNGVINTNTPTAKTFKGRNNDLEWAIDEMMMSDWWECGGYLELEVLSLQDAKELQKLIPCQVLDIN